MKSLRLLTVLCLCGLSAEAQWASNGNTVYTENTTSFVAIGRMTADFALDIETSVVRQGIQISHTSGRWARFFAPAMTGGAYNNMTKLDDAGIIFGTDEGGVDHVTNGFVIAPHRTSVSGLRITPEGAVGIGTPLTNNPNNYLLAVNGTVGAKAVKVENNSDTWPDYVFDDAYRLRSLTEVAAYIKQHKHLPEMPVAAEIAQEGVDLGEMNRLLLKKVEELTLYVIEQNERAAEQTRKAEEQAAQLTVLSEKIEQLQQQLSHSK